MCQNNNILVLTLAIINLNNIVSSYSLATMKTDLDNFVNSDNFNVQAALYSESATCSPSGVPKSFTSNCCGNRYMKNDDRKRRSVGSEAALSTEYPWVVLLEYPVAAMCSGFLISNSYVLTAAHCIVDVLKEPTSVRLGHHGKTVEVECFNSSKGRTCNDGAISVPIENIIVHSNYSKKESYKNDIALIKLKNIVHYSEYIQPICLPTFEVTEKYVPGVHFEVAGWGTTRQSIYTLFLFNYGFGKNLTKVKNMPYKSNDECQKLYDTKVGGHFTIRDTNICAGGVEGKGPCSGDSGGPLMYKKDNRYIAVGIVSFTTLSPCAFKDVPAVFTNIYKYDRWILQHTSENNNVIFEVTTLGDNSIVNHNNVTLDKLDYKLFNNVSSSNHGTVLTNVTRSLIVILFCIYYVLY